MMQLFSHKALKFQLREISTTNNTKT